jgi:hypothetical protein
MVGGAVVHATDNAATANTIMWLMPSPNIFIFGFLYLSAEIWF